MRRIRLAYLVSHPIQYQAPLLRCIAAEPGMDFKVFFSSAFSTRRFVDPDFGRQIEWDVPLLDGYEHEFLPMFGAADRASFWRPINYGLTRRLRDEGFDALWVHGYMRWHHWVAMTAAKRLGMRVLVRDEATAISTSRGALRKLGKRGFFAWLARIVDQFLAIGSLNRDYYRANQIPDRRIFSVPYAVDNVFFQRRAAESASRREALRASLGLDPGRPITLFVGKLIERKRPGDLLDAYARLSPDGCGEPRSYLLYAGDGELRQSLEARAARLGLKSVRFLGFKEQTALPALYDLCDVFVTPSMREAWGLTVNEAMNAARAVIVSDRVGCAPDLVRHGENGFIFKAGDCADLSKALGAVLADPVRCTAMGRGSLEIISRWGFEEDLRGLRAALES